MQEVILLYRLGNNNTKTHACSVQTQIFFNIFDLLVEYVHVEATDTDVLCFLVSPTGPETTTTLSQHSAPNFYLVRP